MKNQELLDLLYKAIEIIKTDETDESVQQEPPIQVETPTEIESKITPEVESPVKFHIDKNLFDIETWPILDLLQSSDWPEAVHEDLICTEEESDKIERASGIIEYFDLTGKKFLDFGCGEGHVAFKACETNPNVVGYDIVQSGKLQWESPGCLLTTDFSKVVEKGPYDIVLVYDVLDHCRDSIQALKQLKAVCSPNAKVIVRCHSWMSRHGSHLYRQANKAWIHLFFSEDELKKMGLQMDFVQVCYYPIAAHKEWFANAGFKLISESIIKSEVESFFRTQMLRSRIGGGHKEFPEFQMSQTFNDYVLNNN